MTALESSNPDVTSDVTLKAETESTVLIVGGGPVGLALAIELGLRRVRCLLVEQMASDGFNKHPRANLINSRSMEFCRRWGLVEQIKRVGTPPDYPHTAMYLTGMNGHMVARIDRPDHGGDGPPVFTPEAAQRCNQIWFDPVLRQRAASLPSVQLRFRCALERFEQDASGVTAWLRDLDSGETFTHRSDWLAACCGGRSPVRRLLGIDRDEGQVLGAPLSIYFRTPELWRHHDKGKGVLHFIIDQSGVWATLNSLNGGDLWRVTLHGGAKMYGEPDQVDHRGLLTRIVGREFPYELIAISPWVRRKLVTAQFRYDRIFLAGDCAHQNTPSGGYGMNTGLGDAFDLGWKLAAVSQGWAGDGLLQSYDAERRPVALCNVEEATRNFNLRSFPEPRPALMQDSPEGEAQRQALGEEIVRHTARELTSDGIAMGYVYANSPVICSDGTVAPTFSVTHYQPTSYPGARAPHVWLSPGKSTLDLFGDGMVLLCLGAQIVETSALESMRQSAAALGVPLAVHALGAADVLAAYDAYPLVLVRPDGHVAWRGHALPSDPTALFKQVLGLRD